MKILLATQNIHKVEELRLFMSQFGHEVLTLNDFPEIDEIIEDGETLEANALLKARAGFAATGLPTIADDTGLEVDALNGAPGVYSARYAGDNVTYDDNVNKLLQEMQSINDNERNARFVTVVVFLDSEHEFLARGVVLGEITKQRIGDSGFGYDPVFRVLEKNKTYAQMSLEEKNQLSHRGRAMSLLTDKLMKNHKSFSAE
jgi:XTP/dITP diphosphohydrolase